MTKSKRIEHMTPEQEAALPAFREGWRAVGLSTAPIHEASARSAVRSLYKAGDCEEPKAVITLASPMACLIARAICEKLLNEKLSNNQREVLERQLRDQLGDQLWGQLRDQLGGQLRDQLWDQLRGQWGAAVSPWRDAYWAALHVAARLSAALAPSPRLDSMARAIGAVDHWWPMRGAVVLTDRPTVIARDGQGRLHSQTGPALAYADGWTIHAVHGVRVPAEVIEHPEAITVDRILTAPNTEVRRVMIDLRGWDWFTAAAGLRLVDTADDPGNPGETITLWDLPEQVYDEPVRVVLVTNASPERDGTRRRYGLTVPADCDSAEGAVAWTFGVDAGDYRSLARAT